MRDRAILRRRKRIRNEELWMGVRKNSWATSGPEMASCLYKNWTCTYRMPENSCLWASLHDLIKMRKK
jgi:hypothetical protein